MSTASRLVLPELAVLTGKLLILNLQGYCVQYQYMDEESQDGKAPSAEPDHSAQRMSEHSLDQLSQSNRESSNHNRRSLIQVMSIDGSDLHEDIYEYYLIEESRRPQQRSSNNSQRGSNNEISMEAQQPRPRRCSSNSRSLAHECNCDDNNCLEFHCSCYGSLNEMCLLGTCCQRCVKMKIAQFGDKRVGAAGAPGQKKVKDLSAKCICSQIIKATGNTNYLCLSCLNFRQQTKPIAKDIKKPQKSKPCDSNKPLTSLITSCSCKKSHCLKKYCACFASNKQCSQDCECEDCQNVFEVEENREEKQQEKQRYSRVDSDCGDEEELDIDQYLEDQNFDEKAMPESMEFEPPNLKLSYHN